MILGRLMICDIGIQASLVGKCLPLLLVSCIEAAGNLTNTKPKGSVETWIAEIESYLFDNLSPGSGSPWCHPSREECETFPAFRNRKYTPDHSILRKIELDS